MSRALPIVKSGHGPRTGVVNKTSYEIRGEGEWLVLIHGVGLQRDVWQPQLEYFTNHYKVLSYDLFGHGQSGLSEVSPDIDTYVCQLKELFEHLEIDSAIVVGHSMGGAIAMRFAYQNPSKLVALAVLNAVFCRSDAAREPVLQRADLLDQGRGQILVEQTLDRWFSEEESLAMPQARFELGEMLKDVSQVGYARAYRVFAESDSEHKNELNKIKSRALFMTGELDPNSTPLMSTQMAEGTPLGQVHILAQARHMMPYVNHQQVNEALDKFFLLEQECN